MTVCRKCNFNPAAPMLNGLCWLCHSKIKVYDEYNPPKVAPKKVRCARCRTADPVPGFTMCKFCMSKTTLEQAPRTEKAYVEVCSPKGRSLGTLGVIHGSSRTDLCANFGTLCMRKGFTHFLMDGMRYHNEYHIANMVSKKPENTRAYVAPKKHA